MPFSGSSHTDITHALPFTQEDYFELVCETGRIIREDKAGFIKGTEPPILTVFGINPEHWLKHVKFFGRSYSICIGKLEKMRVFASTVDRGLGKGIASSKRIYQ